MMILESEELPVFIHDIAYEVWVSVNFPFNIGDIYLVINFMIILWIVLYRNFNLLAYWLRDFLFIRFSMKYATFNRKGE